MLRFPALLFSVMLMCRMTLWSYAEVSFIVGGKYAVGIDLFSLMRLLFLGRTWMLRGLLASTMDGSLALVMGRAR